MKILKYVLIAVGVVVILAVLGFVIQTDLKVDRSIVVDASKEEVMAQVTSLKNMRDWSPWDKLDPNMKVTYEGTDGEVGSKSSWEGNEDVGKGSQEITAITDNRVETKLIFIEPFEDEAGAWFEVEEVGEGTKVTWGMDGSSPLLMSLFMDMEGMIGKDYEKGLAALKEILESNQEAIASPAYEIQKVEVADKIYLAKRAVVKMTDMKPFFEEHMGALGSAGLEMTGAPVGLYYTWDMEKGESDMAVAIPVASEEASLEGYEIINVPASNALKIEYFGGYENMMAPHMAMDKYIKNNEIADPDLVIEEYLTDPTQEPDTNKWQTNIYYLVK